MMVPICLMVGASLAAITSHNRPQAGSDISSLWFRKNVFNTTFQTSVTTSFRRTNRRVENREFSTSGAS